jgi:hypothetical protein
MDEGTGPGVRPTGGKPRAGPRNIAPFCLFRQSAAFRRSVLCFFMARISISDVMPADWNPTSPISSETLQCRLNGAMLKPRTVACIFKLR